MKNNNTNKTDVTVNEEPEVEVLTVTSANDSEKNAETDEDAARKLVEDKYGDEYDIERVVVDGSVINFIGKRKGDTTSVAIRVED